WLYAFMGHENSIVFRLACTQGRRLPCGSAVRTYVDRGDAAIPCEGDSTDMDDTTNERAVRGRRDDRGRVDSPVLLPVLVVVRVCPTLLLPVAQIFASSRLDPCKPLRVEHPVQTGDDDTSGEAVGRRERRLVHPDLDHRVRVHRSIQRDCRGVAVGAG